jgi:ubiquinone/menaquinone biosynthesis C-methylase UbiE
MKDNFSQIAGDYARFRPEYPEALFAYLQSLLTEKQAAWDCATGNGQVALQLASFIEEVYATDISSEQLSKAPARPNIHYKTEAAEQSGFPDHIFDLVTVAQAIHWFDFDAFYKEVKRTLKPGGIFAVIGYGLMETGNPDYDRLIQHFYTVTLNGYWDIERRFIDEHYQTIPFPFEELEAPAFRMEYSWNQAQLLGYLGTWSAVQHYRKATAQDPLLALAHELEKIGKPEDMIDIRFRLLLRLGK